MKCHAAATRQCESNGTWYVSPSTDNPYSNYTACTHSLEELEATNHMIPIYVFIAGYSVSIVMLLISLVIFFAFRQLRCERITVHKNMFVSYVLTGVTWMLYYLLVALDGMVLVNNPVWCQVLHVLANYFTTCNFAWMFCEGLYIHIIMAHAFRTGKMLIRALLFVGWGNPLILAIIYASVRAVKQSNTDMCWLHDDIYQWILFGPVVASMIINIFILINLVRLLVTKLRQVPDAPQSRKVVRATLILVPLFGIQFLIFPVQPAEGSVLYDFYHYFVALLTSLQGTLVSVMYCFCNGEVTSLLRRKWHQHRLMTGHVRKNTALTSSTYTEGYTVVNTSTRDLTSQKSKVAPDIHNRSLQDSVEMKPLKIET
ncbi:hypothetical protein ACOMHN_033526 [Nucella lapillus]